MVSNKERNKQRFNRIIKGKIRKDLKEFVKSDYILGQKGKDKIAIPIPWIDLPKFRHSDYKDEDGEGEGEGEGEGGGKGGKGGKQKQGGVGQGPGDIGDPIGPGEGQEEGEGPKAGQGTGEHPLEIDVTLEELAEILREELGLPNIEPKGKKNVTTIEDEYQGLRKVGPEPLLRFQPTYTEALKREISEGTYDFNDPQIPILKEDKRYLSWKKKPIPQTNAVIIHIMDISGSINEEIKTTSRKISFWLDVWLRSHYDHLESVYIVHDTDAMEVDEYTYYHMMAGGGTKISSAYNLADKIIDMKYPPCDWNVYIYQTSDGENWGDNGEEIQFIDEVLLDKINLFCYAQVSIPPAWLGSRRGGYGGYDWTGEYIKHLDDYVEKNKKEEVLRTSLLKSDEDILDTLRKFLSTGK